MTSRASSTQDRILRRKRTTRLTRLNLLGDSPQKGVLERDAARGFGSPTYPNHMTHKRVPDFSLGAISPPQACTQRPDLKDTR